MLNQTVLVGRLTKDPEIVTHENGKKISAITLAVQRSFKNTEGIYETDFIRCILWNGIAENTCEYCHTGDVVGIKGRLQTSSYQDEQGKTKYVTEVIAERVTFLTSKKDDSNK
jgi:single-strand DNA-binding protein